MKKYYTIVDNEVVINPNTQQERNITKEANELGDIRECDYCIYDIKTCKGNKEGIYCDWFTITDEYEELEQSF